MFSTALFVIACAEIIVVVTEVVDGVHFDLSDVIARAVELPFHQNMFDLFPKLTW